MSSNYYIQQEIKNLKQENEDIKQETQNLRQFIAGLSMMMVAADHLHPNADVMPLLNDMLLNAMAVTHAEDGSLLVLDDETGGLVFVLSNGNIDPNSVIGKRVPSGEGVAGWVVENRESTIVNQARSDARFFSGIDEALSYTTNSILAAPLIGDRRVLGVIELLNKRNAITFSEMDETMVTILCRFMGELLSHTLSTGEGESAPA